MASALIVVVSSMLVQREAGPFDLRSAAEAAALIGLLTFPVSFVIASLQRNLDLSSMLFLLVAAPVLGFRSFFGAFTLFPRLDSLAPF